MGYLRLNPECHLVTGAVRGCIYNLVTGDVVWLGEQETSLIVKARGAVSIQECLDEADSNVSPRLRDFVAQLVGRGIAREYEKPHCVPSFQRGLGNELDTLFRSDRLVSLQIEVNQECGLACGFCAPELVHKRGTGCGRHRDTGGKTLTLERRLALIDEGIDLGVQDLLITGGDPFLSSQTIDLVRHAVATSTARVSIWTGGASRVPNGLLAFGTRLRVYYQVFSGREEVHDWIVGAPGALSSSLMDIQRMRDAGVECRIVLIVVPENAGHFREASLFYQELTRSPVEIRPLQGAQLPEPASFLLSPMRRIPRMTPTMFTLMKRANHCFNGRLAVTDDGRILPCLLARKWSMGDTSSDSLAIVLKDGRHRDYWYLKKDTFPKCSKCEFRYGCMDCRVAQSGGGIPTDVLLCGYDCETGRWQQKEGVRAAATADLGDRSGEDCVR